MPLRPLFRFVSVALALTTVRAAPAPVELTLAPGEFWWGGHVVDGPQMPFGAGTTLSRDLFGNDGTNQAQPLLLSSQGRFVWSEQPFRFDFAHGTLRISKTHGEIVRGQEGASLREAFRHVSRRFFPADGRMPEPLMFSHPPYKTWIELQY